MKCPKTDVNKWSLPGLMTVLYSTVHPSKKKTHIVYTLDKESNLLSKDEYKKSMVTVYDKGVLNHDYMSESFAQIRERVESEWEACPLKAVPGQYPVSQSIVDLQKSTKVIIDADIVKMGTEAEEVIKGIETARLAEESIMLKDDKIKQETIDKKNTVISSLVSKTEAILSKITNSEDEFYNKLNEEDELKLTNLMPDSALAKAIAEANKVLKERSQSKTVSSMPSGLSSQSENHMNIEYPLMRLNALLDNLESRIEK